MCTLSYVNYRTTGGHAGPSLQSSDWSPFVLPEYVTASMHGALSMAGMESRGYVVMGAAGVLAGLQ